MDILSFEKMVLDPDFEKEFDHYINARTIAAIKVNGIPYIDIVEPLLKKAARFAGYRHAPERYIYVVARELFDGLTELLDKETNDGNIRMDVMLRVGVYDIYAPECIVVEINEDSIIWKSCCHEDLCDSRDKFPELQFKDELPVFRLDSQQYKDALEQLQSMTG
jgi:hypothetical protein